MTAFWFRFQFNRKFKMGFRSITTCRFGKYSETLISFLLPISARWTEREVMYVSYVGQLFLRMLKALILPLIIPSLVAAVGSLDMSISGKVGGRAVGYYMATTVLAVILGIILVSAIHPGKPGNQGDDEITKVTFLKRHSFSLGGPPLNFSMAEKLAFSSTVHFEPYFAHFETHVMCKTHFRQGSF